MLATSVRVRPLMEAVLASYVQAKTASAEEA